MKYWKHLFKGMAAVKAIIEWHEKHVAHDNTVNLDDAVALVKSLALVFDFDIKVKV